MKKIMMKKEQSKGITLIALSITIIVLIILAGITISFLMGNNGILNKTRTAKENNSKATATEKINLKITSSQIDMYGKEQRMPTLKELSLSFEKDGEIEYVTETSKLASVEYNVPSDNPNTIYTKLKEYPYEFEIDSNLKLASIDGVKIANNSESKEIEELKATISNMQTTITSLDSRLTDLTNLYNNKNYKAGTAIIPACKAGERNGVQVSFSEPLQNDNYVVSVLSNYSGIWWAQTSYTVVEKTSKGFFILCFNNGGEGESTVEHPVDWLVVPKTQ